MKTATMKRGARRTLRRKAVALALDANCSVRDAARLRQSLLDLQDIPAEVVLDVGAVERMETAGLQLLSAFVMGRRAAGRSVTWKGTSAAFDQAVELLGLNCVLGPAEAGLPTAREVPGASK